MKNIMSFDEFDEDLVGEEPVKSKTPASKIPRAIASFPLSSILVFCWTNFT